MATQFFYIVLVNWILGIALVEWALLKIKPLHIKTKKDEEMAQKYPAFRRNDLHKIYRPVLYLLAPLVLLKFALGVGTAWIISLWVRVFIFGH
jgi:hypothetical protein